MRLGKEQAAGYVEDTETVPAADEIKISHPEAAPATAEAEPAVRAG